MFWIWYPLNTCDFRFINDFLEQEKKIWLKYKTKCLTFRRNSFSFNFIYKNELYLYKFIIVIKFKGKTARKNIINGSLKFFLCIHFEASYEHVKIVKSS